MDRIDKYSEIKYLSNFGKKKINKKHIQFFILFFYQQNMSYLILYLWQKHRYIQIKEIMKKYYPWWNLYKKKEQYVTYKHDIIEIFCDQKRERFGKFGRFFFLKLIDDCFSANYFKNILHEPFSSNIWTKSSNYRYEMVVLVFFAI